MADTRLNTLLDAWAAIRALHHVLWTLHWQAEGAAAYGDHKLYQRLYGARVTEIDRMAELIAALYGPAVLDPAASWARAGSIIDAAAERLGSRPENAPARALALINAAIEAVEAAEEANVGTQALAANNVLAGIADALNNAAYLVQQRAR